MSLRWTIFAIIGCSVLFKFYSGNLSEFRRRNPEIMTREKSELEDYELRNLIYFKNTKRNYLLTAVVIVGFSIYMGAWLPYQANVERENQKDAYLAGYSKGWEFYCDEIFNSTFGSISSNGILYSGNYEFNSKWCEGLEEISFPENSYIESGSGILSAYSSVDSSESKGFNAGYMDSKDTVFSRTPYLCYGNECISNNSETLRLENRAAEDYRLEQESDAFLQPE